MAYAFTADTFSQNKETWDKMFEIVKPSRYLEIGSYEGRSLFYAVESIKKYRGTGLVTSIDAWVDTMEVEQRFKSNVAYAKEQNPAVTVEIRRGKSAQQTVMLLAEGRVNYYDLVYVDGATEAPDVLNDLLMAYQLVRPGGLIICNNYLWTSRKGNPVLDPKMAIDVFTNVFYQKVGVMRAPLNQVYLHKV